MKPFKEWLPTLVAFLMIGGNIALSARWIEKMESRMEAVEEHTKDQTLHMPWDKRIELFITRREAEKSEDDLTKKLDSIDEKLDFIYRNARNGEK